MTCQNPMCTRAALTSSSGTRYAYCDGCTRRLLSTAFAPEPKAPTSWHARARAGTLPGLVIGGERIR
jgi:hypothetical protein